ncbi:hypothetical protein K439DRAFT_1385802 [Ramaria rubella]|nr:hypothetical protein K439DRAFT_1385802 [Ramaria rubella]
MSQLGPQEALLFVFGECGPDVTEDEFHDWYNNEHAPLRLTVKGFNNALRYKAIDGAQPTWLALYDLSSTEVMATEDYKALRGKASPREFDVVSRLLMLDRRLYTQISARTHPETPPFALPGKYLLVVQMETSAEADLDFNKWYEEEHMGLLEKVPGWLRGRRYKFLNQTELGGKADKTKTVPAMTYLAVHEFNRSDWAELPEFKHAGSTPWRLEVLKTVSKRELRSFELYKDFGSPQW